MTRVESNRAFRLTAVTLLAAMVWLPVLAANETLPDDLRRCAKESDDGRRLACFDAIVNTLPKLEADRFGMTAEIAHKREPATPYNPGQQGVLGAKITGLRQTSGGEWVFTLDNQQVWVQQEARSGINFSVGEAVQIEHGAMGTLWLAADKHRKTRVKRLQ
jgi:hypothetical protein